MPAVAAAFSTSFSLIICWVIGELPAAQGWRPTDILAERFCARAMAGMASAPPVPTRKARRRSVERAGRRIMAVPPCFLLHGGAVGFRADQFPDRLAEFGEGGTLAGLVVAGAWQIDWHDALEPTGMATQHDHAIGQEHRLVDRMGDEQHG